MKHDPKIFHKRQLKNDNPRPNDYRSPYSRDKARIIHGAGFRRLQGKTQVMGAGEGDFHRTRLTHSIEVNQIGLGLYEAITKRKDKRIPKDLEPFMKNGRPVISAACLGHDLGHPPFGHGGEKALHTKMRCHGGFEGNAQTIRLLVKLEKYHKNKGINPTRRVLLSVLKYPVDYHDYPDEAKGSAKPPKCYYHEDRDVIDWCLEPFSYSDREQFIKLRKTEDNKYKPQHMSFDASMMECADDIAYCTHDLEDIVARRLVTKQQFMEKVGKLFNGRSRIKSNSEYISIRDFEALFDDSYQRKKTIGKLVNMLMGSTQIFKINSFEHPLLKYRLSMSQDVKGITDFLRDDLTYGMVVAKPEVQMLERKGQHIISALYDEFSDDPSRLIPNWEEMDIKASKERKVSDYVAGMTDAFAAKIYHRLFTPGIGPSSDEL